MNKKVSIIIPVYNTSKYLNKCIDSALNQTYKNIEVICIENGSEDSSLDILKSYKDKIKLYVSSKKGLSKARNKGIEMSTGEYIYFLDSDDYIDENCISEMVKNIEEKKSDIVFSLLYRLDDDTNNIEKIKEFEFDSLSGKELYSNIYKLNYGPIKLYKSSIIKDNDIKFPLDVKYEDVDFVMHYLSKSNKVTIIDKYLYYYRIHSNSETTTIDENIFDILKILKLIRKYFDKDILENFVILTCTRYSLRQRYQKNKKLRYKFIDEAYKYMETLYPKWKKSEYMKTDNKFKRIIKKNKLLVKIYTTLYYKFKVSIN